MYLIIFKEKTDTMFAVALACAGPECLLVWLFAQLLGKGKGSWGHEQRQC